MVEYQAEIQLISLLEKEALSDLNPLDLPSLNESEINVHPVRTWYFETEKLIRGLKLVQSVNEQLFASGVTQAVLDDRGQLLKENNALKSQVDSELKKAESWFNKWMIGITFFLVMATFLGLLFQGWGTQAVSQDHKYLHIQSETPLFSAPSVSVTPTINIPPHSTEKPSTIKE